jgi:hypothetical protein
MRKQQLTDDYVYGTELSDDYAKSSSRTRRRAPRKPSHSSDSDASLNDDSAGNVSSELEHDEHIGDEFNREGKAKPLTA